MAHAIAVKHGGASHTHASTVDTSQYTQAGSEKGGGGTQGGGWSLHSLLRSLEVLDDLMSSISFVKLELQGFVPVVIRKKPELTYRCMSRAKLCVAIG